MKRKRGCTGLKNNKIKNPDMWNKIFFWAGFVSVLFMVLPYMILGQDAILVYHDQLDGEVIAYLLQAKHLLDGSFLPEFMGGVPKTALIPPAPGAVLFFLGGNAFFGLVVMQLLGSLCGYLGMYACVKKFGGKVLPAVIVGVFYAYLPFLPVYGLSQYGLPMLLYLVLEASEGRHQKLAIIYGVVYALLSSLVLVGFGVLGVLALWMIWRFATTFRKKGTTQTNRLGIATPLIIWCSMLVIYVMENLSLLSQTLGLGGQSEISHKTEYALIAGEFWEGFRTALLEGGQHSEDYHRMFLWLLIVVGIIGFLRKEYQALKVLGISFGFLVFFALIAGCWNAAPGIALRNNLQALGAFQLERLLWMAPCLWYLMYGVALSLVSKWFQEHGLFRKPVGIFFLLLIGAEAIALPGLEILLHSNLKPNLQKLRNPAYEAISFNDYYAVGVYEQVDAFLEEQGAGEKSGYRVVSLGIDPAAALFHDYYSLDGYSNNYPLSYKHAFRDIIAPELLKSEYLRDYFDEWGNRCYILSAECPGYYTVEKGGFFFADLELDTMALSDMGAEYLFSAAYIANAEEIGLTLLREEPFSTEDSYYQIYVYGVEQIGKWERQ